MKSLNKLRPEHTEGSECTCASPEEHAKMVAEVDESFKKDDERARMRTERSATYLQKEAERIRAELTNGHRE